MNWMLVALLLYLASMVAIGAWVAPRIRTEDDFLLAGRRLGYPLTIFSIFATWFGAETVIASGGRAYRQGFALTTAEPLAYGLCLIVMGLVFAVPLWNRRLTTLADLFRTRYSIGIERLAAVVLIPSSIFWAAAQLRGFAHVLTTVTSLQLGAATAAGTAFCILYTMLGGSLADAITDLVQGIVLVAGILLLAGAVLLRFGSPGAMAAAVDPAQVSLLGAAGPVAPLAVLEEWAIPLCGSVVAAELVSRVIAARSGTVARNGAMIAGAMYLAVGLLPVVIGLTAAGLVAPVGDPDRFLPTLALALLPPWAYVIFAGALASAILSTVNTILLVTGGIAAHNIVGPLLGITGGRRALLLARLGVVPFGIVAYLLALGAQGITSLVESASAFGSAGVLVVVCFALFSRRGGPLAAAAALLGGLVVYLAASFGGAPYPYLLSLGASLALYVGVAAFETQHGRLRSSHSGGR